MVQLGSDSEKTYWEGKGAGYCFTTGTGLGVMKPEKCKTPSAFFIVADSTYPGTNKGSGYGGAYSFKSSHDATSNEPKIQLIHAGKTTVGYVDGHVAAQTGRQLNISTTTKPRSAVLEDGTNQVDLF